MLSNSNFIMLILLYMLGLSREIQILFFSFIPVAQNFRYGPINFPFTAHRTSAQIPFSSFPARFLFLPSCFSSHNSSRAPCAPKSHIYILVYGVEHHIIIINFYLILFLLLIHNKKM